MRCPQSFGLTRGHSRRGKLPVRSGPSTRKNVLTWVSGREPAMNTRCSILKPDQRFRLHVAIRLKTCQFQILHVVADDRWSKIFGLQMELHIVEGEARGVMHI